MLNPGDYRRQGVAPSTAADGVIDLTRNGHTQALWLCFLRWPLRVDERLAATLELSPRQQNLMVAFQAAQADVGADAHDAPLVAAAGVRLAQCHRVVEPDIDGHRHLL